MDGPDDQALVILRHIRQAMNGDGAVLIIETVTGAPNEGELSSVSRTSTCWWRQVDAESARDHWDALLTDTGFDLVEVKPTESRFSLIGRTSNTPPIATAVSAVFFVAGKRAYEATLSRKWAAGAHFGDSVNLRTPRLIAAGGVLDRRAPERASCSSVGSR